MIGFPRRQNNLCLHFTRSLRAGIPKQSSAKPSTAEELLELAAEKVYSQLTVVRMQPPQTVVLLGMKNLR